MFVEMRLKAQEEMKKAQLAASVPRYIFEVNHLPLFKAVFAILIKVRIWSDPNRLV